MWIPNDQAATYSGFVDELTRLSKGKYLSLTTFRKSGEGVATPVWVARDGEHLYVTTRADSWKVKRLRNNPEVLLAPCDMRGNLTGTQVSGHGEVLDSAASAHVRDLINKRYGLTAKALFLWESLSARLGRAQPESVGLRLTPQQDHDTSPAESDSR